MRAVVQRVSSASVTVDGEIISQIGAGLLVLLGIHKDDTEKEREYIIKKIVNLRIFPDSADMHNINKSIKDTDGEILLVSQFTLYGDCKKGNRPSFIAAMPPEKAKSFYEDFAKELKHIYPKTKEGMFGAYMHVALVNDGPVTILLNSARA